MEILDFYPLAQGMMPNAPPRSRDPRGGAPVWKDMLNLRPHDGVLKAREYMASASLGGGPTFPVNTAAWNQQPILIATLHQPPHIFNDNRLLVVTTRQIWLVDRGTWYDWTPSYNAGQATVSGGGVVTGSGGTLWKDRVIAHGQLFQVDTTGDGNPDGPWWVIDSVASNTSLTLQGGPPITPGPRNYFIKRTFDARDAPFAFAKALNGDIYLGGLLGHHAAPAPVSTEIPSAAVIKLDQGAGPNPLSITPVNSFYLTASNILDVGCDPQGFYFLIYGLDILDDGRIVVAANTYDIAAGRGDDARILYSSHLDRSVWTSYPGGFTPLVQSFGALTAMGRIGRSLTLHFANEILLAEPTGQDDPPLYFVRTRANRGAISPSSLRQLPGSGEMFVAGDSRLYLFEGDSSVPQQGQLWDLLKAEPRRLVKKCRASVDTYRQEFSVWIHDIGSRTKEYRYGYGSRTLTKHEYNAPIAAICDDAYQYGTSQVEERRDQTRALFGTPSFGNGNPSELVYRFAESTAQDVIDDLVAGSFSSVFAETDDLDFGQPGVEKVIERVELFVRSSFSASLGEDLRLQLISRDGTIETLTGTVVLSPTKEALFSFYPQYRSSETWRLKILSAVAAPDNRFFFHLVRMRIHWAASAASEVIDG